MRGKFVADGSGELHSGGISVAGGCVVEWGAAGAGKKERRQEKSDATLFLYEESGYRKVSCRRIGFDCIGRSADKWGTFVHKKKSAAESVTPEVLVNPQIQQNSAHPSGSGLYLNLQKIYQISGCQYNRLYLDMLRTHAITVYCIAKVINFRQSATTNS